MKKHTILFLLAVILCSHSCVKVQKNVHDYYPQVKTTAVTVNPDGSVTVVGEVVSSGSTGIEICGFCMDTIPNPDMISNQAIATALNGNTFSCTYSSLNALDTYYFKAFAGNANGYATGNIISVSHAGFDTSAIPCHPQAQHMVLTGTSSVTEAFSYVNAITQSGTGYEVLGHTDSHTIDIVFTNYPLSGVYTDANITFDAIAVKGATLYVQQISSGVIDITICSANVSVQNMFSGVYYPYVMTTKFRSPS